MATTQVTTDVIADGAVTAPKLSASVVTTTGSPANGNLTKFTAAGTISNADLTGDVTTSGTVASTIANNAVTNAKMAQMATMTARSNITGGVANGSDNTITAILDAAFGSTQGDVLYRGASSWTALAPGTSGQVLTSGGASANPSWGTGAGALVYLATYTGTSLSTIDITSVMSSTYDDYEVHLSPLQTTSSASLLLRMSTDNGSSFVSGSSDYSWAKNKTTAAGANSPDGSTGDTAIAIYNDTTGTGHGSTGKIFLYNMNATAYGKRAFWQVSGAAATTGVVGSTTGAGLGLGSTLSSAAVNAIRLLPSTGTFDGTVRIYGVKKS